MSPKNIIIIIITIIFILLNQLAITNTVYVVLSSDTSIWSNTSGGDDAYTYANEFDFDVFANPNGVYHDVFDSTFRTTHTDSLGYPFKVTWFMHGGGWFQKGTNSNSTTTMYQIRKYWQDELDNWGDALEYHFHHFKWTGSEWAMAPTFAETIWDYEWTTSQMVIDESTYPVSFRSGWNYMDNPYQQYLELWLPFRMEGGSYMTDCTPYHPSYTNYRVAGTMKGWEVRHVYMKDFTVSFANQVFNVANQGKEQVVCIWSHQNEADYVQQIASVDTALHSAATTYPDVQFLYCTAKESMQKWLQSSDTTPPTLNLSTEKSGNTITVTINTDPDIYQLQPYVAARNYSDEYSRLETSKISADSYQFSYSTTETDRVVVAVSDEYGNVSLAEVKDGSRRWSTQSEFYHSNPQNIDVDSSINNAVLNYTTTQQTIINQPNYNSSTNVLHRAYWIGQTFVPQATGISKVVFNATVTQPTEYRIELRTLLPSGFPDDNPSGLLAFGTTTLNTTGVATVWFNYMGLQLDGRSYVLLFKIISGNANLRINILNPYPNGILIRAFSLDWITIPNFDCYFQIFDQSQNLSIDQSTSDSQAYVSEKGYFVAQTFQLTDLNISGIEINVTNSLTIETIDIQLRDTLPDGSPDYSYDALLNRTKFQFASSGIQYIPLDWTIPPEYLNDTLALVFLGPQESKNSIQLAYNSSNSYPQGNLFFSTDLVDFERQDNSDLYIKLFSNTKVYLPSGTLTMQFDGGTQVYWNKAEMATEIPENTSVRYRFRFGNTPEELNTATWSAYYSSSPLHFQPPTYSRLIQTEILLESTGSATPVLDSIELFYSASPSSISNSIWLFF